MNRRFILALAALLVSTSVSAQAPSFFRIVSGSAGGNYFPMAGILANAISNPPGSRACDKGGGSADCNSLYRRHRQLVCQPH